MKRIQVDPQVVQQLCPELMLAGPFTGVEFCEVYVRPSEAEKEAISFMREWTNREVAGLTIDRTRKQWNALYPADVGPEIGPDGELLLSLSLNEGFDYGHFAATSRDDMFAQCFNDYTASLVMKQRVAGLSRQQFEFCCRHRMPANAILCVTRDNQMLWVRRKADVFLHPGHLHTLGITLHIDDDTAEAGLYRCLKQEANVEPFHVDAGSILWVGVSDNEPQRQPILLGLARLLLTADEVAERLPEAIRPDGRGIFLSYEPVTFHRLLLGDARVTPSGKVFAYLMREGLLQGILQRG